MSIAVSRKTIDYVETVVSTPPDVVEGMTMLEVTEELQIEDIDFEDFTTLICLKARSIIGVSCENDAGIKLLDENTFIRDEKLAILLNNLERLGCGKAEWLNEICTSPVEIVHRFYGARDMEEFALKNKLDEPLESLCELQILDEWADDIASMGLSILGLYPSGYLCTLPVEISRRERQLLVVTDDPAMFLDPYDEDQSLQDIRSFVGKLTIFAVAYQLY